MVQSVSCKNGEAMNEMNSWSEQLPPGKKSSKK